MELQDTIEHIIDLNKELQGMSPLTNEQKEALAKKFRLEFNYNSNHIEGNTLTYVETELLLIFDETRGSHPHRDFEEMKASDVALEMIEQLAIDKSHPLTESFIKNLNQIILVRPYWKEAVTQDGQSTRRKITVGDYKKYPNSVLLPNGEIFNYASPAETPQLMAELIGWLRAEEEKIDEKLHPVEIAAMLHYKFVRIHPFDDGNGRISRLLMNYLLIKNSYPPVIIKSEDKNNYLNALHDADAGNLDSFNLYIAKQLVWSLELSIKAARNESLEEQEDWKKKLTLIRKQLADKETISVVKSNDILLKLLNEKTIPFATKLMFELKEFDGLFLYRKIFLSAETGTKFSVATNSKFGIELITKHFKNNLELEFSFEDFTKDTDNPFSLLLVLKYKFLKHKYEIFINDSPLFTKLYHQEYSTREFEDAKNVIGRILIAEIEKRIKLN